MSRLLAIDDNPDNLISVQALLRLFIDDCEVLTALSGREGLEKAAARQPDTILLDIHMPGMDGFEVCRRLKSDPVTAVIPVVMLTAVKTDTRHRVKALELGADAFLTKPINEAELVAQVKAMLRIKRAEDKLRREKAQLEEAVQQRMNDLLIANEQLMIEISERERAQETLRAEFRLNKAVADISGEILSEICDIEKISDLALSAAKELTGSAHGFISTIDRKTLESLGHDDPADAGGCRIPDSPLTFPVRPDGTYGGLWGHALDTKAAFFTNSPQEHPSSAGRPAGHIALNNFLGVPVFIGDTLNGLIALANKEHGYSEEDLAMVRGIAKVFALARHRQIYEIERESMEKNLRQLQKNEAIGALAGGIAHDFNNILFPIIGFAELLVDDLAPDSPLRGSVDEILAGSLRAKDLVKQILAFSRQAEQEIRPLKPHLIIKEVTKLIRATIPTSIEIRQHIPNDCRTILADPTQIHQVAMNLITNAFHAMEEKGGILTVTLKNTDTLPADLNLAAVPHVLLEIGDTGVGMDRKTIEKIFDPYFSTKPKNKGTGLGLSVVHGIVTHYGGDILVDSTPGQGSCFKVFLPARETGQPRESKPETIPGPVGSGRILLVDDESAVLRLERQMLQRLGYDVDATESSLDALVQLKSYPDRYDLVITDLTMPKLTGDRLTRKIREAGLTVPVIICTGFSEKITPETAGDIGATGLLMKPVVKMELARAVQSALETGPHPSDT